MRPTNLNRSQNIIILVVFLFRNCLKLKWSTIASYLHPLRFPPSQPFLSVSQPLPPIFSPSNSICLFILSSSPLLPFLLSCPFLFVLFPYSSLLLYFSLCSTPHPLLSSALPSFFPPILFPLLPFLFIALFSFSLFLFVEGCGVDKGMLQVLQQLSDAHGF